MIHLHSYPSVYAIGHKAIQDIFEDEVLVEEKIDGSQFSFGVIEGELTCRSKGADIYLEAPQKMFEPAIEVIQKMAPILAPDTVYRAEYLMKPKHNTLAYDRIPNNHLIIFDICPGLEEYLPPLEKEEEAKRIGLECVPLLYQGKVTTVQQLRKFLERTSVLGGSTIEGMVFKNYNKFTPDKKVMVGKFVSEAFKEVHAGEWKKSNPSGGDIIQNLINEYRTPARWQKAVVHLREAGEIEQSPRDIGKLIKEVPNDILKECEDEIKDALFAHAWPKIRRGVTGGLPEWYKEELAKAVLNE